jgi:hypothetical protein
MDKEVLGLQGYVDKRPLMSIHDGFFDGNSPTTNVLQNNFMNLFVVVATVNIIPN